MPVLPLDYTEPFWATLGLMLYPGIDELDRRDARAFAAQSLAEPIRHLHTSGGTLSYDALARITMDAGQRLTDLEERWWGGTATGAVFWILFLLANLHRELASGNNAIKYAEALAGAHKRKEIPHGFMVGERSFSNRGAPLGVLGKSEGAKSWTRPTFKHF